ncbi:MAG: GTPase Era [Saprospiraceae bacterium]
MHKSGFINIVGRPNVGKSTLMNALVGERMSIITAKPQTTRHRILGILSGESFQMVFSDTPGMIDQPAYRMQQAMNAFVRASFEDADLMLLVTEPGEPYSADDPLLELLRRIKVPRFLIINKTDLIGEEALAALILSWKEKCPFEEIVPVSALHAVNTAKLLELILQYLPEGPEYFPKDQLTDRPERFFVSEIIREKILLLYHQEIPYSVEVIVESFKEGETTREGLPLVRIAATIFVSRKTQKPILIGKNGESIKKLGTEARLAIEKFLEKKVFLELFVKVKENWRDDELMLKRLGYLY